MGYTIYWEKKEIFSDYEWGKLWNAYEYFSKEMKVGLDPIKINTYTKYIKKYDDRIIFNGIG